MKRKDEWLTEFERLPRPGSLVAIPASDFILSPKRGLEAACADGCETGLRVTPETLAQLYVARDELAVEEQLAILDAYRCPEAMAAMRARRVERVAREFPDWREPQVLEFAARYTAAPWHLGNPPHSRGDAVDITIYRAGSPLVMAHNPANFQEMRFDFFEGKEPELHANRLRLREVMSRGKFIPYDLEYWHFGLTPVVPHD